MSGSRVRADQREWYKRFNIIQLRAAGASLRPRSFRAKTRVSSQRGVMGLFDWLLRRMWKRAVAIEIQKKHGLDVRAVADRIGAERLDEILNEQFERTKGTPTAGVLNVEKALLAQHGIDLQAMAIKARFE